MLFGICNQPGVTYSHVRYSEYLLTIHWYEVVTLGVITLPYVMLRHEKKQTNH